LHKLPISEIKINFDSEITINNEVYIINRVNNNISLYKNNITIFSQSKTKYLCTTNLRKFIKYTHNNTDFCYYVYIIYNKYIKNIFYNKLLKSKRIYNGNKNIICYIKSINNLIFSTKIISRKKNNIKLYNNNIEILKIKYKYSNFKTYILFTISKNANLYSLFKNIFCIYNLYSNINHFHYIFIL